MADEEIGANNLDGPSDGSQGDSNELTKSYDLSQVMKVSRGNKGFVSSVIQMFIVKTPLYIDRIVKSFEAQDYEDMGEAAHQLKQSVYAMGVNSLRIPVMAIVLVGRKNSPGDDLPMHIANLKKYAEIVIQELKNDFGM